jgi:adenylate cyclase
MDQIYDCGEALGLAAAITAPVEALLARASHGDVCLAQNAVDRLANTPVEPGFALYEVPTLRLRALLSRFLGDETGYRGYPDRYRAMATSLGFAGHVIRRAWPSISERWATSRMSCRMPNDPAMILR